MTTFLEIDSGAVPLVTFEVSWWPVQCALNNAVHELPDVNNLQPKRLGVDEHLFRSVRYFKDPEPTPGSAMNNG